jgi:hypothetical protein
MERNYCTSPWWLSLNNLSLRPTAKQLEIINKYALKKKKTVERLFLNNHAISLQSCQEDPANFLKQIKLDNPILSFSLEHDSEGKITLTKLKQFQKWHSEIEKVCYSFFEGYCKLLRLAENIKKSLESIGIV